MGSSRTDLHPRSEYVSPDATLQHARVRRARARLTADEVDGDLALVRSIENLLHARLLAQLLHRDLVPRRGQSEERVHVRELHSTAGAAESTCIVARYDGIDARQTVHGMARASERRSGAS